MDTLVTVLITLQRGKNLLGREEVSRKDTVEGKRQVTSPLLDTVNRKGLWGKTQAK